VVLKLGSMSEGSEEAKPVLPEKLLIDDPSNFQFHAAYLTYSDVFDRTNNAEGRKLLNENIEALQQNRIDASTFYRNISQFRPNVGGQRESGRTVIRTQRKREWRRQVQKHERIERHKK
jgi:hypothetical protein